ncbi:hypothetical protein D3C87_795830 [compost metagenome]
MKASLSVSGVVRVTVTLTPAGAKAQSLSNLLVMGTSAVIDTTERYRTYTDLTDVANDFGLLAEEYKTAALWFSQAPQPNELMIARWIKTAAAGGLRGAPLPASSRAISAWNAITTGSLKIGVDGVTPADVTGLNFSGAVNLNAVAAIIDTAVVGATVVWNAFYNRFELTSQTTGITSAVSFAAAAATGVDISELAGLRATSGGAYLFAGAAPESLVSAVQLMDSQLGQKWYGVIAPSAVDADHLAVAEYIEGTDTKHTYWLTTSDAGVLVAATTSDIAYQLNALGYKRTFVQFSSSSLYAVASAAARLITVNYNGSNTTITLKFKQEPGVVAEDLNTNQAASAKAKNANVFVNYNNDTAIIQEGTMADGTFADIVTGTDWLAVTIQAGVWNRLYTSTTKVPQTDPGTQRLTTACEAVCAQGIINGLGAPGVWNSDGFGTLTEGQYLQKGYYIWAPSVDTQAQADRAARKAVPIQIAYKLAGAIHSADVAITVNQ